MLKTQTINRVITPTQATQITQATQALKPVPPLTITESTKVTASIDSIKRAYEQDPTGTKTYLSNYNDPTELNSWIDATVNRKAVSNTFGDTWGTISTIAGIVELIALATLTILAAITPIPGDEAAAGAALGAKIAGTAAKEGVKAGAKAALKKAATATGKFIAKQAVAPLKAATATTAAKIVTGIALTGEAITAPAKAVVLYNTGIKPILNGKPDEALLNTLMNIGESMDAFANPIKGLILEGGEGFIKASGLSDEGRKNYDYNTGCIALDMALEVVSDPTAWIDIGGGLARHITVQTSKKNIAKPIIDNAVQLIEQQTKQALSEEAKEQLTKKLYKYIKSAFKQINTVSPETAKLLSKEQQEAVQASLKKRILNYTTDLLAVEYKDLQKETLDNILGKAIQQSSKIVNITNLTQLLDKELTLDNLTSTVFRRLSNIGVANDTVQRVLKEGALWTSGLGKSLQAALIKPAYKGLQTLTQNIVLNKATKNQFFKKVKGFGYLINLDKYAEAKQAYPTIMKYALQLDDVKDAIKPDYLSEFRIIAKEQFEQDNQAIIGILKTNNSNVAKAAIELDQFFNSKYGVSFEEYLNKLTTLSSEHDELLEFKNKFIYYKDNLLLTNTARQSSGLGIQTIEKVYGMHNTTESIVKKIKQAYTAAQKLTKTYQQLGTQDYTKLYKFKLNNSITTVAVLTDPEISAIMTELAGTEGLGAFLTKLATDPKVLAGDSSALLASAIDTIKTSAKSFQNTATLYTAVCSMLLPVIDGVNDATLKRAILDEILGLNKPIKSLLADIDNTINELNAGVRVLLNRDDIIFDDVTRVRLTIVLKTFLEQQDSLNIEHIQQLLLKDFATNVDTLIKQFPDFATQLQPLTIVKDNIIYLYKLYKDVNTDLATVIVSNAEDLFRKLDFQVLADEYGLATKTLATKDTLELFDIDISTLTAAQFEEYMRFGQAIKKYMKAVQANKFIDTGYMEKLYKHLLQKFEDQMPDILKQIPVKYQNSDYLFGLFAAFAEQTKNNVAYRALWNNFNIEILAWADALHAAHRFEDAAFITDLWYNVRHSSRVFQTEYAWDAMSQTAWLAEKRFNEDTLNFIKIYKDLGNKVKGTKATVEQLRNELAIAGLDNPLAIQYAKYAELTAKYDNNYTQFQEYYNSLFDKDIAKQNIQDLRDYVVKAPNFFTETDIETINELEKYYAGELTFEQAPKYTGGKDTFTPFWNRVKEVNRHYAQAQRYEHFGEYLSLIDPDFKFAKLRKTWFDLNTDNGMRLREITCNPRYSMTDEDYKIYAEFLKDYEKEFGDLLIDVDSTMWQIPQDIPWEFLPAEVWDIQYRYLYDICGITDIKAYPKILERITHKETSIGFVNTTNPTQINLAFLENENQFKEVIATLKHESTHSVFMRAFGDRTTTDYFNKLNLFLQYIQTNVSQDFFKYTTDDMTQAYTKLYWMLFSKQYNTFDELIADTTLSIEAKNTIIEEIIAEYLANGYDIPWLLSEIPAGTDLTKLTNELWERLREVAEVNDLTAKAQGLKSFDEIIQEQMAVSTKRANIDIFDPESYTSKELKHFNKITSNFEPKRVTPWDPFRKQIELNYALQDASNANAKRGLYNILQINNEEDLIIELAYRGRVVAFTDEAIQDKTLNGMFTHLRNKFKNNDKFSFIDWQTTDPVTDRTYQKHAIILTNKTKVGVNGRQICINTNPVYRKLPKQDFIELQAIDKQFGTNLYNMYKNFDDDMFDLIGSNLGDSQGEFWSKTAAEQFYTELFEQIPALKNKEIYVQLEDLLDDKYFQAYTFNQSVLGNGISKRAFGMYSGKNIIVTTQNTLQQAMNYTRAKSNYINAAFDSQFSTSTKNSFYANYSDRDLLEALQKTPDYKMIMLYNDNKGIMHVKEVLPLSEKIIHKAREAGAIIVPLQVAKDMYAIIERRLGSTGFLKYWNRLMYAFKSGFLISIGAATRNFFDTNLKSMLEGVDFSYYRQAHKILKEYDSITEYLGRLQKAYEKAGMKTPSFNELLDIVFKTTDLPDWLDIDAFNELKYFNTLDKYVDFQRNYAGYGVSDSLAKQVKDFLNQDAADNGLWHKFTEITGKPVEVLNQTERYNRLATYLKYLDEGYDNTAALARVSKVHFDYSFKSKSEQLIEMVFPFTTFGLRNMSYWAEMLDKNPWILRTYVDLMKPQWHFQNYTPQELARDKKAQTRIKYGQFSIASFNNKLITFKLNPSINDAIQMFTDPVDAIRERLATPISLAIDAAQNKYVDPVNAIPLIGQIASRIKTAVKTGTPVPTLIGVQEQPIQKTTNKRIINYKNTNLKNVNKYRDNYNRIPRYTKNVIVDSYKTIGVKTRKINMYPVIDVAYSVKQKYSQNVNAQVRAKVKQEVLKQVQRSIRTDINRFKY